MDKSKSNELQDDNTTAFVMDASKFVAAFGSVVSQSAPHLYLSALPFAPERSKLDIPARISKTTPHGDWETDNMASHSNYLGRAH
jgi:hypothetical protein